MFGELGLQGRPGGYSERNIFNDSFTEEGTGRRERLSLKGGSSLQPLRKVSSSNRKYSSVQR